MSLRKPGLKSSLAGAGFAGPLPFAFAPRPSPSGSFGARPSPSGLGFEVVVSGYLFGGVLVRVDFEVLLTGHGVLG